MVRLTLSGPGGSNHVTVVTDSRGSVGVSIAPLRASPGVYTLSARVENSPHLDAATVTRPISFGAFEVEWNVPASVVRSQELTGSASVRFAERPFTDAGMTLDLFGPTEVGPDAEGVVRFTAKVPTVATLGTQTITLTAPGHATRSTTFQVVAIPELTLDAPNTFETGSQPDARITLTDDQGDPIRNAPVTLTAVWPAGVQRTLVTTDSEGRWSGPLNLTDAPEGSVSVSARYEGGDAFRGGEDSLSMSAVAPQILAAGGTPWWLLPLVGVALAGGGGAAWWYVKARPRRIPVAAATAAAAPVERPTDLQLAFGIPPGEPAVWGVGDRLALHARNHAEAGIFSLAWEGGSRSITLAEDASASTDLVFPDEGDVTITAQREGGHFAPTSASVRIVDYRKETAREFDLFLDKARGLDASLTKRSTPREISWTLAGRLGVDTERHLDEIAFVLEVTNYSHYDVSREHYLRFVRAARALDGFFAQPPVAGG